MNEDAVSFIREFAGSGEPVTSRKPDDLPAFTGALVSLIGG